MADTLTLENPPWVFRFPEGQGMVSWLTGGIARTLKYCFLTTGSSASASSVHPKPFRKMALLRCHNILAVTVESSSFKSSDTFDNPGKTWSSFLITLSGVLPITYTQEHMVFDAIPPIIGGKLTNT